MRGATCLLVTTTIALLGAASARAGVNFPVDDFEILPFNLSQTGPGGAADLQFPAPPQIGGHIISSPRQVTCTVGLGGPEETTSASLYSTAFNDAVNAHVSAHGSVGFLWDLGYSADLTAAGTVDRIDASVSGPDGALIRFVLVDENDSSAVVDVPDPPANIPSAPLSAFTGVDLQNVTQIILIFIEPGDYGLFSVRLRGEGSGGVDFDIHQSATFVPALPSPPVTATLWEHPFAQPLFDMGVSIVQADAGFTPDLSLTLGTSPAFADGDEANLALSWTDLAPFEPLQLGFSVDLAENDGSIPMAYPPDPVYGPEGIALSFPTMVQQGAARGIVGSSETWITLDPGSQQAADALTFENVVVTPHGDMTGFEVSFLLVPGAAGVETIWPLLEMTWWSEWTPTNLTATPVTARAGAATRLVAVPSVTRGGTEIRADRPFETATRLLVHDVLGRRVTTLRMPAGERSVRWEGRDRGGRPVPAGVYFVNVAGERDDAVRVVKLR